MSLELSCAACEVQVPPVRDGRRSSFWGLLCTADKASIHNEVEEVAVLYAVSITLAAMGCNDQAALKSKWHYYS